MSNVFEYLSTLTFDYKVVGKSLSGDFATLKPVTAALADSFVFIDKHRTDQVRLATNSQASLILLGDNVSDDKMEALLATDNCFIIVADPKLVFTKVASLFVEQYKKVGIHPTAVIGESTAISATAYIGPYCTIGENCSVGDGTVIHANVNVYDDVSIGNDVEIHSGAVLGMPGFGYIPDQDGDQINFPHIGGVIIQDRVVLGSGTMVVKGALGDTIIGENTKIDNLVHVGHNVKTGRNCLITAHAMMGGSVYGDNVWIGPNATVMEGLSIGNDASVTMGSMVTRSVEAGQKVTGYMAQAHRVFMKKYLALFK